MSFNNFKTYGDSPRDAFETFCTQLFERYLKRKYGSDLVKFRVVNGAGGDGGIEAYGEIANGDIIAVQAKWFPGTMEDSQIKQIGKSITMATRMRNIKEYIICVPRAINSIKIGKGQIPATNTEESRVDKLTSEAQIAHTSTTFTWWFEQDLENQLMESDNEGMHRFWFDRELISMQQLINRFDLERRAWINKRYTPELHGSGVIQEHIGQVLNNGAHRKELLSYLIDESKILLTATNLIPRFRATIVDNSKLSVDLEVLYESVRENLSAFLPFSNAIDSGISPLPSVFFKEMQVSEEMLKALEAIIPSDRQLGVLRRLIENLNRVKELDLQNVTERVIADSSQIGRLFLGNSGTGKTHAFSNTVDVRLRDDKAPAIIIRAKGSLCDNWTSLLKKAIDIDGWNTNEILSALETLAVRTDHNDSKLLEAGEEVKKELAKVVICVDGLEEDIDHWSEWYERIREGVELSSRYPRIRFVYTARPYFLDSSEVPKDMNFRVVNLPAEGDIPVFDVMDRYFNPDQYNIVVEPKSLIRGIDSLYALRLFCELYEDKTLTAESEILTAEKDLLNEKIERIEKEFRTFKNAGPARRPIRDTINVFSEVFLRESEIEHDILFNMLKDDKLAYLGHDDVEKVIEFLVNNGFLSRSEVPTGTGLLRTTEITYTLTYQSIMELIMAEKYTTAIANGEIQSVPSHLLKISGEGDGKKNHLENERIVQQIVNNLFHEHDLLIGRDGTLDVGIESQTVGELQTKAMIKIPKEVAGNFRENVTESFFRDHKSRFFVFKTLIFPSALSSNYYFGAEFLHEILMNQATAFEREKVWLGWDSLDIHELGVPEKDEFYKYDLKSVIDPNGEGPLYLPEFALYNEVPLVYGWALTTLDQSLRERLRVSLTSWGISQPMEFNKLLIKLFSVNDPQIQEDLASIALGIASRIKGTNELKALAEWALENVFGFDEINENIIVRMGFRAVVEKAYLIRAISVDEVLKARPKMTVALKLIPVDSDALEIGGEEIYPIVHDLAWYVIKRASNDFMEYESVGPESEPENNTESFLKKYLDHFNLESLDVYSWTVSSAIGYIKSLGFSRTSQNGNGYTEATHGSKSKNFTLEEKYTWLAVHHIQAYLSDNLPLEKNGLFLDDYMKINNIDNPAEELPNAAQVEMPDIEDNWLIKESLAPEMVGDGTFDEQIEYAVNSEPTVKFQNWIEFKDDELYSSGKDKDWLALFNYTSVHDSQAYITASVDIRGVLIEKGHIEDLTDLVENHHDASHFVERIDGMVGSPDTDTYSNPSDVVWMQWINEIESGEKIYYPSIHEEKDIKYTVTSVTRETVDGEEETYIPSKIVREFLGITEMNNGVFFDGNDNVMAINHILSRSNYDRQEMTLVPKTEFLTKLEANGLEIVWFVDLYRSKNALNQKIKSDQHPMKTRKYLVYYENNQLKSKKFWDARFSNRRDKHGEV
jgi:hypothetical protein